MFSSSLLPAVCRRTHVLFTLFVFVCCVQHILCFVFVLFFFDLCALCCQFLWIVHFDCPFYILWRLFPMCSMLLMKKFLTPCIRLRFRMTAYFLTGVKLYFTVLFWYRNKVYHRRCNASWKCRSWISLVTLLWISTVCVAG